MEVEVELAVAADVRDARVPEADEVLGGEARDGDVVDGERAHARDRSADADERLAELVQSGDLVLGEFERHGDDGVDALAEQEVLEHARALAPVARQVVEREVVAAAKELLLGALEHRREEPSVQERDHHADVARAPRCQARGVRRHDVPEARRRLDDLRLRGGGDMAAAAERARDRRGGDPREFRDLFDAGHALLIPASPVRSSGRRRVGSRPRRVRTNPIARVPGGRSRRATRPRSAGAATRSATRSASAAQSRRAARIIGAARRRAIVKDCLGSPTGGGLPTVRRLEGNDRVKWVKRIVIALAVVFALFYLITRPEDAANAVEGAVGAVWSGVEAVGRFFTSSADGTP